MYLVGAMGNSSLAQQMGNTETPSGKRINRRLRINCPTHRIEHASGTNPAADRRFQLPGGEN
jgi:hypothetical protein